MKNLFDKSILERKPFTETYRYDGKNRLIQIINENTKKRKTLHYNISNKLNLINYENNTGCESYSYNDKKQLIRKSYIDIKKNDEVYIYYKDTNMIKKKNIIGDDNCIIYNIEYLYDQNGNITKEIHTNYETGNIVNHVKMYDKNNNLIYYKNGDIRIKYDYLPTHEFVLVIESHSNGYMKEYILDNGYIVEESDNNKFSCNYIYDTNGILYKYTDSEGNIVSFEYNDKNLLTKTEYKKGEIK